MVMRSEELDHAVSAAQRLLLNLSVARHAPERRDHHASLAHINLEAVAVAMRRIVEPQEDEALS